MNVEDAFAKTLGRQLSNTEKERLSHLRDAFGIRDNDALWIIVMVLEYYDSIYREYPKEAARVVTDVLAGRVPAPGLGLPAQAMLRAGRSSPTRQASNVDRDLLLVTGIGLCTAFAVLLGVTCMAAGASMQAQGKPFWVAEDAGASTIAVAAVLGAPAGWIVVLVLVVPAWYACSWAWTRTRDMARRPLDRAFGWITLAAVGVTVVGWLTLLAALAR